MSKSNTTAVKPDASNDQTTLWNYGQHAADRADDTDTCPNGDGQCPGPENVTFPDGEPTFDWHDGIVCYACYSDACEQEEWP